MYRFCGKRFLDIVLALLLAIPALILSIICIVAIRAESSSGALFRQKRVGQGQREFTLYKLRTMLADTGDRASHEVGESRITKVGRILRKTKLDELPQILNVLKGDMSFVGPRPCLVSQQELLEEREIRGVFNIRPGITGPAQLQGVDMSTPRQLAKIDAIYVEDMSFVDDLRLMINTGLGRGSGDAASKPKQ